MRDPPVLLPSRGGTEIQAEWAEIRISPRALGIFPQNSANGKGAAGLGVGFQEHGGEANVALGNFKACRQLIQEFLNHRLPLHADDRFVWTGHAEVCEVSSALRKHRFVSSGNMRMRSQDGRHTSIEVPTQSLLLGGRLGVHVHDADLHVLGNTAEKRIRLSKGAVEGGHKDAALEVDDGIANPRWGLPHEKAMAGSFRGVVSRPQQTAVNLVAEISIDLFFIPNMIARS